MALLTAYWGLDGMILMTVSIICAYLFMTRKFLYWKKRGIDEITPTPFFGNFADCFLMKKSAGDFVKELYDRSPDIRYSGFYIFDRPFLLVRDPELAKNVLVRDANYFPDRYSESSPDDKLGSSNLFIIKNPAWKLLRTKLTPIFTSGKLKRMFQLMLVVGKDLDTHLKSLNLTGSGRVVELKELCAKYTTDLIGTTAYGLQVNSLNNPDAEFRKCGREIFEFNFWRSLELTSIFFSPQLVKPMGFQFFSKKNTKFLRYAFWDTIKERERSGLKRNDFVDLLVELKKSQAGSEESKIFEFDGDNLVAQAAIFFTGGFETSSTTLSLTLYELALSPDIQTKLREEINSGIESNNGDITYDMVTTLPYLDMVVSEALRKWPPLGFLDRVANADYKIPNSDDVIEKGTPVYISMLGLHYDPRYYPDPQKFDPERFSEENKKNRKAFVYMPFGDGPHICIGLRLGLLQVKLGLIHILSEYEVTPCKETMIPIRQNPKSMLTAPDGGVFLNLRKI
ncbi:cytochrome P450 6k1-like [Venturia canescens]|uniref:cytochrome P450 6k1-like n=1 Tax=Venturia canescens TaxID=32260 RepID=UPI001C9C6FA7|nr:cytochrome P450 6k1-like [Venturia canescens]